MAEFKWQNKINRFSPFPPIEKSLQIKEENKTQKRKAPCWMKQGDFRNPTPKIRMEKGKSGNWPLQAWLWRHKTLGVLFCEVGRLWGGKIWKLGNCLSSQGSVTPPSPVGTGSQRAPKGTSARGKKKGGGG